MKDKLKNKALKFRNECDLVYRQIEKSDYSKKVHKERHTLAAKRKRDKEEFDGSVVPNPNEVLPLFFDHPETQV